MVIGTRTKELIKCRQKTMCILKQPWLSISQLKQIQSHLTISGSISDPFASSKLLTHYTLSHFIHATILFPFLPIRSGFMWNTMIKAFVDRILPQEALSMYKLMLGNGNLPNNFTFSFLLRACGDMKNVVLGSLIHCQVVKLGWLGYDFVQNGLVHMYVSCGCVGLGRKVFDMSLNRDVITWTALISGYLKNGEIKVARELFDSMFEKNEVTWSAMINGYVQIGLFKESLDLFNDMLVKGVRPNYSGIVGALSACAFLGALDQGKWIHAYIGRNKMKLDMVLGTALIDMYAKCGCMEAASCVFDEMPIRDVFAFTALISGLANHGKSVECFDLLVRMNREGVRPNEVTFICILSACGRMGLVEEGLKIFESMNVVYGIEPGVEHYGCLVDLLGRAGMIEQAKKVVSEMPMEPDSYVLGALLNACRVHGDVVLGDEMVSGLTRKKLGHGGVHVLLSNIFASLDQWEDVEMVRKGMVEMQVKKIPGCSLIEVDGTAHEFVAGDRCHELIDEIVLFLEAADKHLKSLWLDEECKIIEQVNQLTG